MESDYESEDDVGHEPTILTSVTNALIEASQPFVSKQAQKAYLGTFLFTVTAICIVFGSALVYVVFYYKYIPDAGFERVVHLQFGDGNPWGTTQLGTGLVSLQPYDISVELELPRTPANLDAGNFMLDLALLPHPSTPTLKSANGSTHPISRSRRPAILTYASPLVDTANKLSLMPLYVLGWHREAEKLVVPMMEQLEFPRGWRNLPASLHLEIHSREQMQIYSAKVAFTTKHTGIRWWMYNWKLTSFVFFASLFWTVCMTTTSVTWMALAAASSMSSEDEQIKVKKESRDTTPIKQESSEDSVWDTIPGPSGLDKNKIKTESKDGVNDDQSGSSPADHDSRTTRDE
ncbi:putative adipose-regulatory protein-domain-containing protein [Aspergillus avenaceus]|uniref:Putative adipose-regulatory protein-domain-containing protein n=1 Tax=Aspergillus avenaceus TaxID=36643 RepID=A0A5N6TVZ4_ASPAV|nr:putative adipose-regulatory protein-domain-containing protein [Aspergillus avenaceus]